MSKKKCLVSILILNYNNADFLNRSIKSCLDQSYKNIEILIFDDKSKDDSILRLKKYKNKKIKIIKNKSKKTGIAAFDAKNGYYRLIKRSRGEIISLLDSDDHFKKNKILEIIKIFKNKKKINFVQNLPLIRLENKTEIKKNRNNFLSFWPYLAPESCISFRKNFIKKFFKKNYILENNYNDVWLGFRLGVYAYFVDKSFYTLNKNLTFYKSYGESKKYRFLSLNWFKRRLNSYHYLKNISKNNVNLRLNLDYFFTKVFTIFLKTLK